MTNFTEKTNFTENLKLKLKLIGSVYDLYRLFVKWAKLVKDSTTLNLRMRLNALQFNTVKYFAKELIGNPDFGYAYINCIHERVSTDNSTGAISDQIEFAA